MTARLENDPGPAVRPSIERPTAGDSSLPAVTAVEATIGGGVVEQSAPSASAPVFPRTQGHTSELWFGLWSALWAIMFIAVTTAPSLIALTFGAGRVMEGNFFYAYDSPQFLAAIHQGRTEGAWLLTNRFTAEPHQPAFIYPLYLALGNLARLLEWTSEQAIYLWASFMSRLALCVVLVALVHRTLDGVARRWVYPLMCLTGAFCISVVVVSVQSVIAPGPSSFLPPVPTVLTIMYAAPHGTIGLALLLGMLYLLCDSTPPSERSRLILLATGVLLMGIIYPFLIPVAVTTTAIGYGLAYLQHRDWRAPIRALLLVGLVASPFVAYNGLLFYFDPFWRDVYGPVQNAMPSPPFWYAPVYFGVLGPLAVWTIWRCWRAESFALQLVAATVLSLLVWMYLPVSFQGRTSLAVHPLLAILAAAALAQGWAMTRPRLRAALLAVGFVDTLVVLGLVFGAAFGQGPWPVHALPTEHAAVATWLAPQVGRNDVVLAPKEFSGFLASRIHGRVVSSEAGTATRNFKEKQAWVSEYFDATTSVEERAQLEEKLGNPTWIVGPKGLAIGSGWERQHEQAGLAVYRRR